MSRLIETRPFVEGRGANSVTLRVKETPFFAGGSEEKSLLEGTIGRHPVSLVTKYIGRTRFVENWIRLHRAGVPVVPTLRDIGRDHIVMTDLKADGSELYGEAFFNVLTLKKRERERPRPEIDRLFVELTAPSQIGKVADRMNEIIDRANKASISLPGDDMAEMIVHPDGTWDLVVLDLQLAQYIEPDHLDARMVPIINTGTAKSFIPMLERIRQKLIRRLR